MFDQVVFACHADTALSLIETPSAAEQRILGAFRFQTNRAYLHRDTSLMPRRRAAWASWVYRLNTTVDDRPAISVSYWMNRLQGIDPQVPLFVTLNPERSPEEALIEDRHTFSHPVFDQAAVAAQERLPQIQGADRLWFCGAWQRYGFHEDGLWSAVCVGAGLGVGTPWTPLH
jgi:predicted NAD/FAD-binding protein